MLSDEEWEQIAADAKKAYQEAVDKTTRESLTWDQPRKNEVNKLRESRLKELQSRNAPEWHCSDCRDSNYIPPSAETLETLRKAIESAKVNPPVYRGESFTQYAGDEDPMDFDLQAGGLGMSLEEILQKYPQAGFTVGMTVEPGVISDDFKRRLQILRDEWIDVYDIPSDPLADYLFNVRKLTFLERCSVGWQLWKGGVAKYPWPVKQNKEFR
jgi:hypothetical protein